PRARAATPVALVALCQAEAADLDRRAAIHDDLEAGGPGPLRGGLVDHAELHPDRAGADRDRLVDVRAGGVRPAEDVDDVDCDAVGQGGQARLEALAEDLLADGIGVDRDDPVAAALEQSRDPVAVAVRAR